MLLQQTNDSAPIASYLAVQAKEHKNNSETLMRKFLIMHEFTCDLKTILSPNTINKISYFGNLQIPCFPFKKKKLKKKRTRRDYQQFFLVNPSFWNKHTNTMDMKTYRFIFSNCIDPSKANFFVQSSKCLQSFCMQHLDLYTKEQDYNTANTQPLKHLRHSDLTNNKDRDLLRRQWLQCHPKRLHEYFP